MKLLLADENFPYPSYRHLLQSGRDIKHITDVSPSITDEEVIALAIAENRLILTFDSDFGDLIYRDGLRPPGVVYFRWVDYLPVDPGKYFEQLLEDGSFVFEGFLTVVGESKIRQRKMPL